MISTSARYFSFCSQLRVLRKWATSSECSLGRKNSFSLAGVSLKIRSLTSRVFAGSSALGAVAHWAGALDWASTLCGATTRQRASTIFWLSASETAQSQVCSTLGSRLALTLPCKHAKSLGAAPGEPVSLRAEWKCLFIWRSRVLMLESTEGL